MRFFSQKSSKHLFDYAFYKGLIASCKDIGRVCRNFLNFEGFFSL